MKYTILKLVIFVVTPFIVELKPFLQFLRRLCEKLLFEKVAVLVDCDTCVAFLLTNKKL